MRPERERKDGEDEYDDETNTLPEDQQRLPDSGRDQEDFDDINETVDQESRPEVRNNKPGPASFDARKQDSIRQKKEDFVDSSKRYVTQIKAKRGQK